MDEFEQKLVERLKERQKQLGLDVGVNIGRQYTSTRVPDQADEIAKSVESRLVQPDKTHPVTVVHSGYPGGPEVAPQQTTQPGLVAVDQQAPGQVAVHDSMTEEARDAARAAQLLESDQRAPGVVRGPVHRLEIEGLDANGVVLSDRPVGSGEGQVGMPPVMATTSSAREAEIEEMRERENADRAIVTGANVDVPVLSAPTEEAMEAERQRKEELHAKRVESARKAREAKLAKNAPEEQNKAVNPENLENK